nr:polyribonucleotide nucleotidyltransferase [Mesoaciditoga lauensis]
MYRIWKKEFKGNELVIENGKVAKQADGAFVISYGDSKMLVTAVMDKRAKEGLDFFPLTVEYQEKFYAAGKIPGGFIKREGRPSENAILSARMIDRPIRPLFPQGFRVPVQIVATVLSVDPDNPPDILGITGASLALNVSPIPFDGIVAGVRIALIDGEYVFFPSDEKAKGAKIDLVVAGTKEAITMVEGEADEVEEEIMVEALMKAHDAIKELIEFEEEILSEFTVEKVEFTPPTLNEDVKKKLEEKVNVNELKKRLLTHGKLARDKEIGAYKTDIIDSLMEELKNEGTYEEDELKEINSLLNEEFEEMVKHTMRRMIVEENTRVDGRNPDEIRPITCELDLLPRAHGSALFTRGETQSLGVVTLGAQMDVQIIDTLLQEGEKRFMLHYNFPPYSVGETGRFGSPGRREIGHGHLAERALKRMIPEEEKFPYTIRVVSEILESNGSSSMATVCSGSLSLRAAGVPTKSHVAGIAMGLIFEPDKWVVLTDILGMEDHLGDMDFKVTGTRKGITAFQMDVKVGNVSEEIMKIALEKARIARNKILDLMYETIPEPRETLSPYAPIIKLTMVPVDKIGELIGPGGRNVKALSEKHDVELQIQEDGRVLVIGTDVEKVDNAIQEIEDMNREVKVGEEFLAKVTRVEPYGFFAELFAGKTGLVHVSKMGRHVKNVKDVIHVGDKVNVEVTGIDPTGKIQLRQILSEEEKARYSHSDTHSHSSHSNHSSHSSHSQHRGRYSDNKDGK